MSTWVIANEYEYKYAYHYFVTHKYITSAINSVLEYCYNR